MWLDTAIPFVSSPYSIVDLISTVGTLTRTSMEFQDIVMHKLADIVGKCHNFTFEDKLVIVMAFVVRHSLHPSSIIVASLATSVASAIAFTALKAFAAFKAFVAFKEFTTFKTSATFKAFTAFKAFTTFKAFTAFKAFTTSKEFATFKAFVTLATNFVITCPLCFTSKVIILTLVSLDYK